MKRFLLPLILAGFISTSYAFIFHDPGAYTQRAAQVIQHMSKWSDQLGKMTTQIQKFQEYQQTFNRYYGTINSIYRKVSHVSWSNLLNTGQSVYRDAQRLYDLLPGSEDYEYLESIDYLTANPLYEQNPDYRRYVDELITRHETLVANLDRLQEQLESIRSVQQDRLGKFDVYEAANEAMSAGTGEASITEQMALLNAISLEQARENHEIASMIRMMLEQQLELERESVNQVNRQGELNRNRPANTAEIQRSVGATGR